MSPTRKLTNILWNTTLTPLRGCSVEISLRCHLTGLETPRRHSSECVSKGLSQRVLTEVGRPVLRVRSMPWAGVPNWMKMGKRESQVDARILCSQLLVCWDVRSPCPIFPTTWIMPSSPWQSPSPILPTPWIMPLSSWWGGPPLKLWDKTSASSMELFVRNFITSQPWRK